jgi:microcystin-dependent protein
MSEKNFVVTGSINIDDVTLDLTSTQIGSSLHRVGTTMSAKRETPVGTVIMYVGLVNGSKTNVPDGWLVCDGSQTPVASYPELDAVVGTRYGARTDGASNPGTTHFILPNLVDRVPIGHIQTNNDSPNTVSTPSTNAGLTSHSHNSTHTSNDWGNGASEFSGHSHTYVEHGHTHGTYGDSGGSGGHNLGSGGQHTHQYKHGNVLANTGASDSNHTHNISNEAANHYHNGLNASANHTHGNTTDTQNLSHTHNLTLNTSDAGMNMNSSQHQHSTGFVTTKVFFLIKT